MTQKKLILHIGYPKTATKTLQKNVLSELHKQKKIEYLNHLGSGAEGFGDFLAKDIFNYVIGFRKEYPIDELISLWQINRPITVLSNESLAHVSEKSPTADIKVATFENLVRLYQTFRPYYDKIELVMTIRNQYSMIHSYYTQEYFNIILNNNKHKSLNHWLQDNFNNKITDDDLVFNYLKMYSKAVELFGKENTHVLVYEDLLHNSQKFFKSWAEILNVTPLEIEELFNIKAQNVTVKKEGKVRSTDKQSFSSKIAILATRLHLPIGIRHFFKILIPKKILNLKTRKDINIRDFSAEEKIMLNKRFGELNHLFCDELNLNSTLKKYSYPLSVNS